MKSIELKFWSNWYTVTEKTEPAQLEIEALKEKNWCLNTEKLNELN